MNRESLALYTLVLAFIALYIVSIPECGEYEKRVQGLLWFECVQDY